MIQSLNFHLLHVNEKGTFTNKILDVAAPYKISNPEFAPIFDEVNAKNQIFSKALEKISFENITRLMEADNHLRANGFVNLRDYSLLCSSRKNQTWALAGQLLVDHIKIIGWDTAQRTYAEETRLLETLLSELDNNPALLQAVITINAQEWIDEIRLGQSNFIQHEAQRRFLKGADEKITSREASRHLNIALDKLVRFVNFQVEFNHSAEFATLTNSINVIIAENTTVLKQRATRIKNAKKKKAANDDHKKDDMDSK